MSVGGGLGGGVLFWQPQRPDARTRGSPDFRLLGPPTTLAVNACRATPRGLGGGLLPHPPPLRDWGLLKDHV